jgi:hypothetical protein
MPFELTNDTAQQDFIDAYAEHFGAPKAYARKLLNELLDQRSYQEATRLRAQKDKDVWEAGHPMWDYTADFIDPTIKD